MWIAWCSFRRLSWIFVAFTIEKPQICFKDEFRWRHPVSPSLLANPHLRWGDTSWFCVGASYPFPGSYLARCLSKAFAVFVVLLGIVKRVFLGHCVWICCCGCGHCLPSLSLCGRGVGTLQGGPVSLYSRAAAWGFFIRVSCPLLPFWKEYAHPRLWLSLQFSACAGHALRSLLLTGWSLNPPHCFSGKRAYWKLLLYVKVSQFNFYGL